MSHPARIAAAAAASLLALAAAPAHAVSFVNVGDSATLNFDGVVAGNVVNGLSGAVTYTLASITGTSMIFNFSVLNSSQNPVTGSRISTFGFDADPNFTSAAITGGNVFTSVSSGNVPQFGPIEFCATAGANCAGGGGQGVAAGGTASGQFALTFSSLPAALQLENFYVRYQSVTAPSLGLTSNSGVGFVGGASAVPEAATWSMMILGFGFVGAQMRRRKRTSASPAPRKFGIAV